MTVRRRPDGPVAGRLPPPPVAARTSDRATAGRDPARPLVIPIFLPHLGCPHRCVFCRQSVVTGRPVGMPATEEVERIVDRFRSLSSRRRHPVEIAFYGGNFLGLPTPQLMGLLAAAGDLVRRGRADGIRFSTRPDTVTSRRLAIMADYPVTCVELGAQSMSDAVLSAAGRGHTADDTRRAVDRLAGKPYRLGLQLMVGLPAEDAAARRLTARAAADLAPDFVRIYPTVVLDGTGLAELWRQGRYRALSVAAAVEAVKAMLLTFRRRGITVARMGLQDGPELHAGSRLAGPFHPAFGERVYSACFLEMAVVLAAGLPQPPDRLAFRVHPRSESKLRGQRNGNLQSLQRRFGPIPVRIDTDPSLPADALAVKGLPVIRLDHLTGSENRLCDCA